MWFGFHGTEGNQLHGTRKEVVKAEMMAVLGFKGTLS